MDLFERAVTPPGPITRETLLAIPQGRTLLDRYLRETPSGWMSVVQVYNLPGRPKREVPPAALELAERVGPGARLTGMNVLSRSLRYEIRRDALVSGLIGLALVVALLWVDFRSWRSAVLALVPLLIGVVWMVGAMVALDLHMNFMNIFVITMIIGIGVDYGIHVIHRYHEEERTQGGNVEAAVEETVRGVFLAALTTVVGFGSLATSHYPGLISSGGRLDPRHAGHGGGRDRRPTKIRPSHPCDAAREIQCPSMILYGGNDQHSTFPVQQRVIESFHSNGQSLEWHYFHFGNHGFASTESDGYQPYLADLAWPLVTEFLGRELIQPAQYPAMKPT